MVPRLTFNRPPPSNNMLYPKEDKENRILLYAVSASLSTRS